MTNINTLTMTINDRITRTQHGVAVWQNVSLDSGDQSVLKTVFVLLVLTICNEGAYLA